MTAIRSGGALRRVGLASLAALLAVTVLDTGLGAPTAAAVLTQTQTVLGITRDQLGKPYVFGATGMTSFDCSGLVYRVYKLAGLVDLIGGRRMGVRGYWRWFRRRGLASRSNPLPGDLIVWLNGAHMGIYTSAGRAIDAAPKRGVRTRRVGRFTTYLHPRLQGDRSMPDASPTQPASTPRPTATPTPTPTPTSTPKPTATPTPTPTPTSTPKPTATPTATPRPTATPTPTPTTTPRPTATPAPTPTPTATPTSTPSPTNGNGWWRRRHH